MSLSEIQFFSLGIILFRSVYVVVCGGFYCWVVSIPWGLPTWLSGKELACQCRRHWRVRFDPWVGKIPWRRAWHPRQYSRLENPMDRGAWWTTVHGVTKESDITGWLKNNNSISWYGCASLFNHLPIEGQMGSFSFLVIKNKGAMNISVYLCQYSFYFFGINAQECNCWDVWWAHI